MSYSGNFIFGAMVGLSLGIGVTMLIVMTTDPGHQVPHPVFPYLWFVQAVPMIYFIWLAIHHGRLAWSERRKADAA